MTSKRLENEIVLNIRFSDLDPMGVVWHGNYVKYFEDGRETFGLRYGLSYFEFERQGVFAPVVEIDIRYKKPIRFGDNVVLKTMYQKSCAAKILFEYEIKNAKTNEILTMAKSIQVFVNKNGDLILSNPAFYEEWKSLV